MTTGDVAAIGPSDADAPRVTHRLARASASDVFHERVATGSQPRDSGDNDIIKPGNLGALGGSDADVPRDTPNIVLTSAESTHIEQSARDLGSDPNPTANASSGDRVDLGRGGYNVHNSRDDEAGIEKAKLGSPDGHVAATVSTPAELSSVDE